MKNNIGYHTRLYADNTKKVCGGSFGGSIDSETVERIVKAHFTVRVKPSGLPVFVDREGREVSLYFSIDPADTAEGKLAIQTHIEAERKLEEVEKKNHDELMEELESLTDDELRALLGKR